MRICFVSGPPSRRTLGRSPKALADGGASQKVGRRMPTRRIIFCHIIS